MKVKAQINIRRSLQYRDKIINNLALIIVILIIYLFTIRGDFGFQDPTIEIIIGNLIIFIYFKFGNKIYRNDDRIVLDTKNLLITMSLGNLFSIILATFFVGSIMVFIIPTIAVFIVFYILSVYQFRLRKSIDAENDLHVPER